MPVPFWQPGNLYQPGDIVQPNLTSALSSAPPTNPGFELGDMDWTTGTGWEIENVAGFEGMWRGKFTPSPAAVTIALNGLFPNPNGTSNDDISWAAQASPLTFGAAELTHSSALGRFLAVPTTGGSSHSTVDGVTWSNDPTAGLGTTRVLTRVDAFGLFIVGGGGGNVYSSPDGIAWTLRDSAGIATFRDFAYSPSLGRVVLAGSFNTVKYSSDGINWITAPALPAELISVVWAESLSLFCGVTSGGVTLTSADGITWVIGGGVGFATTSIAWSDDLELFVSLRSALSGAVDYVSTSTDGLTWTTNAGQVNTWTRVLWNPITQLFVGLGSGNNDPSRIMTSPDGINWTTRTFIATGIMTTMATGGEGPAIIAMINDDRVNVSAGQTTITARGYIQTTGGGIGRIGVAWYDMANTLIRVDWSMQEITGASAVYRQSSVTATAPPNAASAAIAFGGNGTTGELYVDNAEWDYAFLAPASTVIFRAVQPAAGFSDGAEPLWPTVVGVQVIDNEVIWEAIEANRIVWQATAILKSGPIEPVFPEEPDGAVIDNSIIWRAVTRRIEDVNCPNTPEVAILASKVFAGDDDIVAFSATVNPLDWTTTDDAGFIPFGLNTYGSQPISALGIYRSNLVVFNNKAFQMWQVDEDPANFAILDAVPIGCPFHRSLSPISNDLVFLTSEGIRSMGIAGASTNLQAGFFGKQIDPLILEAIKGGEIPDALFFPGAGQYWLFFGEEAFVLTMNGGRSDMSWSRYTFPTPVDDWTIQNQDLFLRSGDKVWRVDDDVFVDDFGDTNVEIIGRIWWPYLDFGALGVTKKLIGFDTVAEGEYSVSIGYNQNDVLQFTPPYTIAGDTIPGDIIPIPVSAPSLQLRLQFENNTMNAWEWSASALHLQDFRRTS